MEKSSVQFQLTKRDTFAVVSFILPPEGIIPDVLLQAQAPDPISQNFAHLGVILSGRGPVWLYGFLVHFYHTTKWVATHDPRLQGAVVVASHTPEIKVGDIISLEIGT